MIYNESEAVYVVLSGIGIVSTGLESDEIMPHALIGKGQPFGVLMPFAQEKWISSLYALTDLEVCKVPCPGLGSYTKQHPSMLYKFILANAALGVSVMRLAWIKHPRKVYDRVVRALLVLNELQGKNLTISHDDMALIVNADRPSVTLALDRLQEEGLVALEYRKVSISTTLVSSGLETMLKPDYDHLWLLPSLTDRSDGHKRRGSGMRVSLTQ